MRRMFGFLIGVFTGSLLGAVLALLLAPDSGEDLRGQLRERGQLFLSDVRQTADARRIELRGRLAALQEPNEDF
ncbi:MAG: YtxH domain-containing protein [Anaerolineales bacterium]|nr:YtxH domain-containing protein [Anaerolineales bacterium]